MRPRDQFRNTRRPARQQHERHLERIGPIWRQHARHIAHPRLLLDPGTYIVSLAPGATLNLEGGLPAADVKAVALWATQRLLRPFEVVFL